MPDFHSHVYLYWESRTIWQRRVSLHEVSTNPPLICRRSLSVRTLTRSTLWWITLNTTWRVWWRRWSSHSLLVWCVSSMSCIAVNSKLRLIGTRLLYFQFNARVRTQTPCAAFKTGGRWVSSTSVDSLSSRCTGQWFDAPLRRLSIYLKGPRRNALQSAAVNVHRSSCLKFINEIYLKDIRVQTVKCEIWKLSRTRCKYRRGGGSDHIKISGGFRWCHFPVFRQGLFFALRLANNPPK